MVQGRQTQEAEVFGRSTANFIGRLACAFDGGNLALLQGSVLRQDGAGRR